MSDLSNYFRAQAETKAARAVHNYAGVNLRLKQIEERLAEIKSQHEPLHELLNLPGADMSGRDRLYAAAFYVVIGRMPE